MSRPLMVAQRMKASASPVGRTPLSRAKSDQRMQMFVNNVANGQIDLNQDAAEVIASYLEKQFQQMKPNLPEGMPQ